MGAVVHGLWALATWFLVVRPFSEMLLASSGYLQSEATGRVEPLPPEAVFL